MARPEPDLYLVRVWRGGGAFRATARRVDEDTLHSAHSVQELAAYLAGEGAPPDPTSTATTGASQGVDVTPAA